MGYRMSGKPEIPLAEKISLVKATRVFKDREWYSAGLMANLTKLSKSALQSTHTEMLDQGLVTKRERSDGCKGTTCMWKANPQSLLRRSWRSGTFTNAQAGIRPLSRLGVDA